MVYFDPTTHTYQDENHNIFDSPSKILRLYKNKFPAKDAAREYAKKHGQNAEYWLAVWKDITDVALTRGNRIHNEKEELDLGRGVGKHKDQIMMVENAERFQVEDLSRLPDGIYPEMVIWNDGWRISGKADRIILRTIGSQRYADIDDYKTNKKISKTSISYYGEYKMMLGPVKHLMDSNYWHYALQLSIYQYIMETHGFKPGTRRLIHIPHPVEGLMGEMLQPKDVIYDMPYLKNEVMAILRDYTKRRTFDKAK